MKKYSRKTIGDHKTCRDRHDFILSSPAKYYARACHQSLTRHFVPPPPFFVIPALLSPPFAGSYGASQSERAI